MLFWGRQPHIFVFLFYLHKPYRYHPTPSPNSPQHLPSETTSLPLTLPLKIMNTVEDALQHITEGDVGRLRADLTELFSRDDSAALIARYDESETALVLSGTITTTHNGRGYSTPVVITLREYPRLAPSVKVVPTVGMEFNVTNGYIMEDGVVAKEAFEEWSAVSTLAGFVASIRSKFDDEAPLFMNSTPLVLHTPSPAAVTQLNTFVSTLSYSESAKQRLRSDLSELLHKHPGLHYSSENGGVSLRGTIQATPNGTAYHIPVRIVLPIGYPMEKGVPEIFVVPEDNMTIVPYHREVDSGGRTFVESVLKWGEEPGVRSVVQCVREMVEAFTVEPPVVMVVAERPKAGSRSPQSCSPPGTDAPPRDPRTVIREKVEGIESTPSEDDTQTCIACLSNKKDVVLIPCRHICMCGKCVEQMCSSDALQCPICRKEVEDVVTGVFF